MIARNWMQKELVTISSDMTAREARDLFNKLKVPFLTVVDNGKLRGILARRDIRQAASFVTATESVYEMNFFNHRMKVKDLMVRKPLTISVDDTVEKALDKGAKYGRPFFPVMDKDELVGTISDRDMFKVLRQMLGVGEKLYSLTLEDHSLTAEVIKEIVLTVYSLGGSIYSLFTLRDSETGKKRLLMRLETSDPAAIQEALKEKGYSILETVDPLQQEA